MVLGGMDALELVDFDAWYVYDKEVPFGVLLSGTFAGNLLVSMVFRCSWMDYYAGIMLFRVS
jgi:hypothetical protein